MVIGGGDTAMDCVRTAVRQGAKSVKCLYRRDRANMPGSQREVKHAEEEGVEFVWLSAPQAFLGKDAGEPRPLGAHPSRHARRDRAARRRRRSPTRHVNIEADLVLKALGFDPEDLPALFAAPDLGVTGWGTLKIDWRSMMTSLDGVFAAGDIVRGASLVVWAVRDGRDAAERIHSYLDDQGRMAARRRRRGVTTMMTLYDFMGSGNGYKVRLVLAQLGLPYKLVERDILKGETRTPEFLAKNPNGRIPTLQLEDGTLPRRIERHHLVPRRGHRARAGGPARARAETLQWMFFEQYSHEPYIAVARFWKHFLPSSRRCRRWSCRGAWRRATPRSASWSSISRVTLFFVGGRYGLADIALYAYTHVAGEGGFNLDNYPHVNAWLARVAAQPGHVTIDHKN